MKIIKENIIELLFSLGVIFISIAAFLTDIRLGFFTLGSAFIVIALFALKRGGE